MAEVRVNDAQRILVIEDNARMAAVIQQGLAQQGWVVDIAASGREGEEMALGGGYPVILLDLMLPDRHGFDVCKSLRAKKLAAPILMLTALSGTAEKVTGLDAGADDYLVKPFEFDELIARIRALLRRGGAAEPRTLRYEDLELDLPRRVATRERQRIRLSPKEFSLLEFLMRNPGRVMSRATLAREVWDLSDEPSSNVIEVYISSLRRKIDRGFGRPLIHTLKSSGYLFGSAEAG